MGIIVMAILSILLVYFIGAHFGLLLLIILGIVGIYFLWCLFKESEFYKKQKIEKNKKIVESAKKLKEEINSAGVFPTHLLSNDVSTLYFDENNRKIYLKLLYENVVINFDDITNYEIVTSDKTNLQYTLGTFVTGRIEQNKDLDSIFVYIYLNSLIRPCVQVLCLRNGLSSYEAMEFAQKIIGTLDFIKNNPPSKKKPLINLIPNLPTKYVPPKKKK